MPDDSNTPCRRHYLCSAAELRTGVLDWKGITPRPVQKAVESLRTKFAEGAWKVGEIMGKGCYAALHHRMATQAQTFSHLIEKLGYPPLPTVGEGQTEPAVFVAWFDRCANLLAKEVIQIFGNLVDIGLAQAALIDRELVDWAELQTRVAIADESDAIPIWTKEACDKQVYTSDDPNELIAWNNWRAPRWFSMQPFANLPYDRGTAWGRMNEADSSEVLLVAEDKFNRRLRMALDSSVREVHVRLAKQVPTAHPGQPASEQQISPADSNEHEKSRGRALTERERKIWEVIKRGVRGMQYCRELHHAGIHPQKTGVWKGCPPNYIVAYGQGKTWRHRIQDEKSKIKKKAELALTRNSLASE